MLHLQKKTILIMNLVNLHTFVRNEEKVLMFLILRTFPAVTFLKVDFFPERSSGFASL